MHKPWKLLVAILGLAAAAIWVDWPGLSIHQKFGSVPVNLDLPASRLDLNIGGTGFQREFQIVQGLDLQGGTELILQVDMSKIGSTDQKQALDSDTEVIRRRVDALGVSEPTIQSSKVGNSYRILVDLPGVKDVNQAAALVGTTGSLEFRKVTNPAIEPTYNNTEPLGLSGKDIKSAQAQPSTQQCNNTPPCVTFETTNPDQFSKVTGSILGQNMAIFLDKNLIESAQVQSAISSSGMISGGSMTLQNAKDLATLLNAGALNAPIQIIEQRTIGATLGDLPIRRSLEAGLLGLLIVAIFMIAYYGRYGVVATLALSLYSLIVLAIFKAIPVTLTLAGIAGFILSVGMAVDANILIFERMREELRSGKKRDVATELGFSRAWTSIRDSNIATTATSLILIYTTTGLVRGFAITLLIGVLTSMFTAVVVTRTLLRVFLKYAN